MDLRAAWRAHYARQPRPWSGPVHASALLANLSGRVVELGAGGGKVAQALPRDAVGVDWAPEGLAACGRACVVADVRGLPFRSGCVDALVAVHVLGHLLEADRAHVLGEWRRVLRPGGVLVLEVFAVGDAREGSGEPVEAGTWVRGGIPTHHFSRRELEGLLSGWEGAVEEEARPLGWGVRRVLRGRFVRVS